MYHNSAIGPAPRVSRCRVVGQFEKVGQASSLSSLFCMFHDRLEACLTKA